MNRLFLTMQARVVRLQRGASTLAITLLMLAILTVVALFATSTAFFELRTTSNEQRARLAEQAAEYAVNLGGEYIKSQLDVLVSSDVGGWLATAAPRWARCDQVASPPAGHPCLAEVNVSRRAQMYFTTLADDTDASDTNDVNDLITAGALASVGGTAAFPVKSKISALLCRIDSADPANPECRREPETGNNIAVTIIASGTLEGENSTATVKETWASYSSFTPSSALPLVASGTVQGLGNAQVVASPNAGGYGLAASVWSPNDVDFDDSSPGGVGSVSTCQLGGFLGHGAVPVDELLTTCAGAGNTGCGCPGVGDPDFLSGHSQSLKQEGPDILDIDGAIGDADLPDITFFPGNGRDRDDDPSDDNLFEWIFNVDYVAEQDGCNEDNAGGCSEDDTALGGTVATDTDCGDNDDEDCAVWAMRERLGFEFVTCAELNTLAADADGLYYIEDSSAGNECTLPGQLGTPEHNVIVVANDKLKLNNTLVYGMLFVRSADSSGLLSGAGNSQVFGSVVVEGNVNLDGSIDLIYYDWAARANDPEQLPPASFFGRVSGSWLDDDDGF